MRATAFTFAAATLFVAAFFIESMGRDRYVFGSPLSASSQNDNLKLDSALSGLKEAAREGSASAADFAARRNLDFDGERVRVVVEAVDEDPAAAAADAAVAGARVEATYKNLIQATIPVSGLEPLASRPSVTLVRQPYRPIKAAVASEGVPDAGANAWHATGARGGGRKVAILDLGFAGYGGLMATSELPDGTVTRSFRANGDITGGGEPHGSACAEIVHDVAPDARLYLINFETEVELGNAVNYVKSQGIDVISASWVFPQDFPGNGTGLINDMVAGAGARGIFWANAAGNAAQNHWSGAFTDNNGNGWTDFDSSYFPDEGNDIYAAAGETIYAFLTWNRWPATDQDYDLYLYKQGSLAAVASSTKAQTGTQKPSEDLSYTVPWGQGGTYEIKIRNRSASGDATFQLFGYSRPLQYQVAAGSIAGQPADSPYALTVGALRTGTNALEGYSSRGPTLDGRIKPDIAASDGISTATYGTRNFYGTSASAPHAAGAAALAKSANPGYSFGTMRRALQARATDLGAAGKDNLFGSGRLNMGSPPPPSNYFTLYNYGSANTGLWVFRPTGSGFAPSRVWASGPGGWEWSRSKFIAADVDGDGRTELTVFYDYGRNNTGLFIFDPDSSPAYVPRRVWLSGPGNWDWSRSKIVAADVDNDGKTELAVYYDYGRSSTGLFIFDLDSSPAYTPRRVWISGAGGWDWSRSKLMPANVDNDGRTELTVFYNYGDANTGLWVFDPDSAPAYAPRRVWLSGAGRWDWYRSKLTAADRNGDGKTELAVFYDYGNASTGLWLFNPNGAGGYLSPRLAWTSGGWEWSRLKIVPVDRNGDGRLAVYYDYGNANTGLWLFDPSGSGYVPRRTWMSGAGNWAWIRSKFI